MFKAHRWLYHSTLGSRVIKKKKRRAPYYYDWTSLCKATPAMPTWDLCSEPTRLATYRGTSFTRKRTPSGPYGRTIPRAL